MIFGLKNAGATYQRLVNYMFTEKNSKMMEVYADDIIVKSERREDHLSHLTQTFAILRRFNMRLNLKKCNFGVESRKFLEHMVSKWGIEANPSKIKAILYMGSSRSVKEVQRLTGCLAAYTDLSPEWGQVQVVLRHATKREVPVDRREPCGL